MLGIFEKDSSIEPIKPSDVVGAGTEELDHRLESMDDSTKEKLMRGMQAEDNALKPYLESSQLEKWQQTALDLAKEDNMQEVDAETDDGQRMRVAKIKLEDIEAVIAGTERKAAKAALQSKGQPKRKSRLDDSVKKFRGSSGR